MKFDYVRAAGLIRFHLQNADMSAGDRAYLADLADHLEERGSATGSSVSDEWRPNERAPQLKRELRLDVQRPGGDVAVSIEDPQSWVEVGEFFNLARDLLGVKPVGRITFPCALLLSVAVMFGLGPHATWQGWTVLGVFWFTLVLASAWSFWPTGRKANR